MEAKPPACATCRFLRHGTDCAHRSLRDWDPVTGFNWSSARSNRGRFGACREEGRYHQPRQGFWAWLFGRRASE